MHKAGSGSRSGPGAMGAELPLYYAMVGLYFFAFGLLFVLFPALTTFVLNEPPERVGLAQAALSAPMFCFLVFGGVLAERAKPAPTLALLQVAAALAAFALGAIVSLGALTYEGLLVYALFAGACAAFIMPVRDAALNGVVDRARSGGRALAIETATAAAMAMQIGAQILGILAARLGGASPGAFFFIQGAALALAAGLALGLRAPKPVAQPATIATAFREAWRGLLYAFRDPVMAPMLISAAYAGVFMVGAAQVLFPLLIRDLYGGDAATQAGRLGALFAGFWTASFVSAVALSRMKALKRPGRALIGAQLLSAALLATLVWRQPFWLLMGVVAVWGLTAGVILSVSRSMVQGAADKAFLGRALAIFSMGSMGGAPIGALVVGVASSAAGPQLAALLPALGLGLAATALAMVSPLWRFEAPAAAPERSG